MAEVDNELLNSGPRRGLELDEDDYTPGALSIDPTISILKRTPMADYNGLNCEVKLNGVPNSKMYTYSGTDEIVENFENTFGDIIIGEYFTVIMYSSMLMVNCVDFNQENKTITFDITLDPESTVENIPLKQYIERGPNIVQTNNESQYSTAEGVSTEANNAIERAEGSYNVSHKASDDYGDAGNTQYSIGVGTSSEDRKNAFMIMQNGDCYVIHIGGYQGTDTKTQDTSIKPLQDVISTMLNVISEMDYRISVLEGRIISYTELQYTTSDGNIVTPWNASALPPIVSNTYSDGKGIIQFAGYLTEIGMGAFYNCDTLTSVSFPSIVTAFGQNAFYNCDGLTSITIPENTSSIGSLAFQGSNITSFTVRAKNLVDSYGLGMTSNGLAQITSLTFGIEVESIPNDMCNYMVNLTNISYEGTMSQWNNLTLADGWHNDAPATVVHCSDGDVSLVESQPNDEIWYTSTDENIVEPYDVPYMDTNTYSDGKGIIKCENDVTSIVQKAFINCSNLASISLPNSVTRIKMYAFNACSNLTSITIPSAVTRIESDVFYDCESLTNITFTGTTTQWNTTLKGTDWNYGVPATVVHCSDGDVNL